MIPLLILWLIACDGEVLVGGVRERAGESCLEVTFYLPERYWKNYQKKFCEGDSGPSYFVDDDGMCYRIGAYCDDRLWNRDPFFRDNACPAGQPDCCDRLDTLPACDDQLPLDAPSQR